MEYRLNLRDSIKAIFLAKNIFTTVIFAILFLFPIFIVIFLIPTDYTEILFIALLTVIAPLGIFTVSNLKNGWKIDGEVLHIKAFTTSKEIKITSMEMGIVKGNSQWNPSIRIWGAGFPGLLVGKCRLKNGKNAVVFHHLNHDVLLVICIDQNYYLIGHPGIEKLYDKLLSLGAKEKGFE